MANMPVLIVALGMTLVILTGQIDISVGSHVRDCGVAAGVFAKSGLPSARRGAGRACAGAALGAINGALVAYVRIPSIVVTLAAMVALRDGLRWTTQGAWVQDLPRGFQWFGLSLAALSAIAVVIAAVICSRRVAWGLRNLAAGRAVYALVRTEGARLAGIDPSRVTFCVFTIAGALTGLRGAAAIRSASIRFRATPDSAWK